MRTDELAIRTDDIAPERYTRQPLPTPRDIVAVLLRQRWPLLAAFALVVIAVALSGMWIPTYEAQMKILALRQRSDSMVTSSANAPSQYSNDQVSEEDLNSEVELLNSDELLRKVVLTTGLVEQPGSSRGGESAVSVAMAVRNLGRALKAEPVPKTNVISVSYEARDPMMAQKVLKALSVAYMEKHLELHRSSGEFKFFDQIGRAHV